VRRWSLTTTFAAVSLAAVVVLGLVVGVVVQRVVKHAATAEAARAGELLARFVEDRLTPASVATGLTAEEVSYLDRASGHREDRGQLRSLRLYAAGGKILYDSDHKLDGQSPPVGSELALAYSGRVASEVEQDNRPEHPEQRRLLEVYVPLRLATPSGTPAVLEVYLPYAATEQRARAATRLIAGVLLTGLAALWALMWWLSINVNRRLRRQAELNEHLALHDALTGLPNRRQLTAEVGRAADAGSPVGLVLLDLDRFKEVNDALGHSFGDELLNQVAGRLAGNARDGELVARLGGDEFAVLVPAVADPAAAQAVGARVAEAFEEPFRVRGVLLDIEPSIGVALMPHHAEDVDTLLQRADVAMYQAKHGHTRVATYDQVTDANSVERLSLLTELRAALGEAGGLHLAYQPTVELATGEVVGVEALVRWDHPVRGLISPGDFVPLAERTGLIAPLTQHVLGLALAQCRSWLDAGLRIPIAVNLSARNLAEADLPARVLAALAEHGVPPELLTLEITESAVMDDPARAELILHRLVGHGVRIALDDFGTGYSSMVSLTRLPLAWLKIDRSFVSKLTQGGSAAVIVTTSIRLAHDLGLRVVAEGVETGDQLEQLRDRGCDVVQGYLLARPMAPEQIPAFAASRTRLPAGG
jgi:diguanylate cyclase (GGDEF)-like protein